MVGRVRCQNLLVYTVYVLYEGYSHVTCLFHSQGNKNAWQHIHVTYSEQSPVQRQGLIQLRIRERHCQTDAVQIRWRDGGHQDRSECVSRTLRSQQWHIPIRLCLSIEDGN